VVKELLPICQWRQTFNQAGCYDCIAKSQNSRFAPLVASVHMTTQRLAQDFGFHYIVFDADGAPGEVLLNRSVVAFSSVTPEPLAFANRRINAFGIRTTSVHKPSACNTKMHVARKTGMLRIALMLPAIGK
jgi:hypothetical protein